MVSIMYKYCLSDVEWKEFFIESIAEIVSGKDIYEKERINGKIPYITATANNNGIGYFVGNDNVTRESACISVNRNGSVGNSFYHHYEALYGNDTRKLRPYRKNIYISLFITKAISHQKEKYGYGYKMGTGRLKRQKIMLPVDEAGNPNWHFMEEYIKERYNKQRTHLFAYYMEKLDSKLQFLSLPGVEWREFFIGGHKGIFTITATQSGIDKNKLNTEKGNTPYITRSDNTNGINLFVTQKQNAKYKMDTGNVITIGLDTQTVFYQQIGFFTGQNIQVLKNEQLNKYIALFIIPLLKLQLKKFSWGSTGATLTRLKRTKIMLPVDETGQPNWAYMEQYIQQIEQKKIRSLIQYLIRKSAP